MYKIENYDENGILITSSITLSGQTNTFLELLDTPNSYISYSGMAVLVKGDETGLEFGEISTVGTFLDLTDTPDSYAGQGSRIVTVKDTEDGLEFVDNVSSTDEGARKLALIGW